MGRKGTLVLGLLPIVLISITFYLFRHNNHQTPTRMYGNSSTVSNGSEKTSRSGSNRLQLLTFNLPIVHTTAENKMLLYNFSYKDRSNLFEFMTHGMKCLKNETRIFLKNHCYYLIMLYDPFVHICCNFYREFTSLNVFTIRLVKPQAMKLYQLLNATL